MRIVKENINRRSLLVLWEEDLIKEINSKIIVWRNYYKTKTDNKWIHDLNWYILSTFVRWYNWKYQRTKHLSQMKKVRIILNEKGLLTMAAWLNAVERRMVESCKREERTYGLRSSG